MSSPSQPDNQKARQVKEEVDQVVGIMHDNISKVMDRGERLDSLQTKTDDLQQGALQFKRGASRVRQQMWWKNTKVHYPVFLIGFS